MSAFGEAFSKLGKNMRQTADDVAEMREAGLLLRSGIMEGMREDFRAKAAKPGTSVLKRAALKTGIALSYLMG